MRTLLLAVCLTLLAPVAQAQSYVYGGTLRWNSGTIQTSVASRFAYALLYRRGRWYASDQGARITYSLSGGNTKRGTYSGTRLMGGVSCAVRADVVFTPSWDKLWLRTRSGVYVTCENGITGWELYTGRLRRIR